MIDAYVSLYRDKIAHHEQLASYNDDFAQFEQLATGLSTDSCMGGMSCAETIADLIDASCVLTCYKQQYRFTPANLVEGVDELVQDENTLDTWFSSALWPFSIM